MIINYFSIFIFFYKLLKNKRNFKNKIEQDFYAIYRNVY